MCTEYLISTLKDEIYTKLFCVRELAFPHGWSCRVQRKTWQLGTTMASAGNMLQEHRRDVAYYVLPRGLNLTYAGIRIKQRIRMSHSRANFDVFGR